MNIQDDVKDGNKDEDLGNSDIRKIKLNYI